MKTFISHYCVLVKHFARVEFANRERIFSPILFAITVLILFYFAFGDTAGQIKANLYVAQTFLTAFFAIQISLARAFEPDTEDSAFSLMQTYPVNTDAWFLAKFTVVLAFSSIVMVVTLLFAGVFFGATPNVIPPLSMLIVAGLCLTGMCSLGILLTAMTLRAQARQILYPLIYFPLVVPLLLVAVQCSLDILLQDKSLSAMLESWLGLLIIFDVVYLTLAVTLFGELIKSD